MANRNGKGPEEKGPRTGRQMGECEGAESAVRRGMGQRRGFGCRRNTD